MPSKKVGWFFLILAYSFKNIKGKMENLNSPRPSLSDFSELPEGVKLQRQGSHWYVFTAKYCYDKEKNPSRTWVSWTSCWKRIFYQGWIFTKFPRNGHHRTIPSDKVKPDLHESEYRKSKDANNVLSGIETEESDNNNEINNSESNDKVSSVNDCYSFWVLHFFCTTNKAK